MVHDERFWSASVNELKQGFTWDEKSQAHICLFCSAAFEEGVIYPAGDRLLTARKAVESHVSAVHGSAFASLIAMDKKYTGLTSHQKELLGHLYAGLSDREIGAATGTSASTVRNHRFNFREKEKQARITLAVCELLSSRMEDARQVPGDAFVPVHTTATMVDERYVMTEKEREQILRNYYDPATLRLTHLPSRDKKKLVVLRHLLRHFEPGRRYSEKEVNTLIRAEADDYATLRRYLIEYGFMDRTSDCREYWLKESFPAQG